MSPLVFAVVILAAAIHATWNALLKGAGSPLMSTVLVSATSGLLGLLTLPFLPPPDPASYPFVVGSGLVQLVYYLLLAAAYRAGDMSATYPIMRGLPPLLIALVATTWLGESIAPGGWFGVALVSIGILTLLLAGDRNRRRLGRPGTGFALVNAGVIASYTLIDGVGVRVAGSLAYVAWLFVVAGGGLLAWALLWRRNELFTAAAARPARILAAGVGNYVAYALVLWAATQAPIPLVAALRETSILFGIGIAALVLREHVDRWRVAAAILIACGAAALRLG